MEATQKKWRQAVVSMAKDLILFGSLCMAQLIVWRSLRRHGKETGSARRVQVGSVHETVKLPHGS